ncbi:TRAP transporter small permease subunit [Roseibacterium sp. SDUM158016]|uniref:TRAP transporter small permease n=1 Tax=Roseicyclus sediminis TaxID=2980997 RepID=UPI0021D1A0CB|nr:TRAP transporter small permease subunit [Roseibacterium sp. SDUM158016]MCU4652754.1 TRAP transporter small permease subunit [Roseibacterium sp. SDUM158016]
MFLKRISRAWARAELAAAAALAVAITGLILTNVVTRAMNNSIFWIDELAIYAMIWMAFLAASASLAHRDAISVTFLKEVLPAPAARWIDIFVDVVVLGFALAMVHFCWRWFDPIDFARAGFDVIAFQGATFNFIYSEPTMTISVSKVWVWMVMPLFALGATLHAVANLVARLSGAETAEAIPLPGDRP